MVSLSKTNPISSACFFNCSTLSAVPFNKGISSLPDLPSSSFANAAFSAPAGIFCKASTVFSKTCSGVKSFKSFTLIPILLNDSTAVLLPVLASSKVFVSFFIPPFKFSISTPFWDNTYSHF